MKKRTVITTEKREVWVISEGNLTRVVHSGGDDDAVAESESVIATEEENSDTPIDKKEEGK